MSTIIQNILLSKSKEEVDEQKIKARELFETADKVLNDKLNSHKDFRDKFDKGEIKPEYISEIRLKEKCFDHDKDIVDVERPVIDLVL